MSSVRARKSLTSQAVVCLQVGDGGGGDDDPAPQAMDMSWPSGARKRITYVLLAPIVFPLWLTLPDTRSPKGKSSYSCKSIIGLASTFSSVMKYFQINNFAKVLL